MEDFGIITAGGFDNLTLAVLIASVVVLAIWCVNEVSKGGDK